MLQIKLKSYGLLLHWWSGRGQKTIYYQHFTRIGYKGEDRKEGDEEFPRSNTVTCFIVLRKDLSFILLYN